MRPEDPELARLLERFVPVRLTSMKGVDLNRFRFDYDQTFAVLMMDAEGYTYSRFGSNDEKGDAGRMSVAGLKHAMEGVLARHRTRNGTLKRPDRTPTPLATGGNRPVAAPAAAKNSSKAAETSSKAAFAIADYPAFAKTKMAQQACYHCHYANDARFLQSRADGTFRKSMLFQYPFPENIGITLEVDRNNIVKTVLPGTAADKAGIRAGDQIIAANSLPILTSADLQFALDPVPEPGKVLLEIERAGKRLSPLALALGPGWRRSDISWRPSQGGIAPTVGLWAERLSEAQKKERGIAAGDMALRVSFLFPGAQAARSRGELKMNDVIVGINGRNLPAMNTRQFHSHFRLNFNVGDTVTLNILRGSQRLDVPVPCVEVRGE